MKNIKNMFGKLKNMPIKKATSFEAEEITGDKPDIKLSVEGHGIENVKIVGIN
ncbi:MAG: hypothetical protein PHV07_00745 [Oscillospiraceae bacterium]|nr:hypothetical protein [Oscillospiraceae bacterium]